MKTTQLCGVLLVNTGTPAAPRPHAVKKYLRRFLMDPRIIAKNFILRWIIVYLFIVPQRASRVAEKYARIWTKDGSPFTVAHKRLAQGLQAQFDEEGIPVMVRFAMNYSDPRIAVVLREMRKAGCQRVIILPLYPQSAYSTTEAVRDEVLRATKHARGNFSVEFIDDYHDNITYIKAIAASVRHAGFDVESDDRLLFSFHSIPLADIEQGDTYELQTGSSSLQIASELGLERKRWTIGYQSHFDKQRDWLTPDTKAALARWAETGGGRVFLVCPNFAVDCLETLYDIKWELKPYYETKLHENGRQVFDDSLVYVACLDRSRAHLKVLMDVLRPYVKGDFHG